MRALQAHFTRCLIAGLVALLPIGGTIVGLVWLESEFAPLVQKLPFYFPGLALVCVVIALYLLGLVVSSWLGRWTVGLVDRLLSGLPALGSIYDTFKQILGYGSGDQAIFQRTVLIRDEATGTCTLGLVTARPASEQLAGSLAVFVPGSPNPAAGHLLLVDEARCIALDTPPDEVFKALFSVGKALSDS